MRKLRHHIVVTMANAGIRPCLIRNIVSAGLMPSEHRQNLMSQQGSPWKRTCCSDERHKEDLEAELAVARARLRSQTISSPRLRTIKMADDGLGRHGASCRF